jgi:cyclohexa-1,5-dienecarbonyl-CoA hydratase
MTHPYDYIRLHFSETGVTTLFLKRPPLNVLHLPMLQEINTALEEVGSNRSSRVLLIRGEGKCFSAGMDVGDHLPDKVELMLELVRKALRRLAELEIPSVSALHGSTMGGGLEIAVMADLTFAAAGTKIGQPEIRLGVFPPLAVAHYANLIGYKKTAELVFGGGIYTAEEAVEMGLINAVFPAEEFEQQVEEITTRIASYSRPVLAATKYALRKSQGKDLFHALENAEKIYMERVMTTADAIEGLNAFLEKRAPQWKHE